MLNQCTAAFAEGRERGVLLMAGELSAYTYPVFNRMLFSPQLIYFLLFLPGGTL